MITARQYFKKLISDGYEADYASSMVNAIFNEEKSI